MKFRSRLFGLLALLSLAWLCYGVTATGSAFSSVVSTPERGSSSLSASDANAAKAVGATLGSGLSLTIFACTGLPFLLIFGLLSWRNSVGLKTQKRHEETLDAMRNSGKSVSDIPKQ